MLVSWLGLDELQRMDATAHPVAPLTDALAKMARDFDEVVLLNNLPAEQAQRYVAWLHCPIAVSIIAAPLKSPVDYREIHQHAVAAVESLRDRHGSDLKLTFFLNSGTPPMGSVWLLLGKSRYSADLLAWSNYHKKVETVQVPFQIAAEFIPTLLEPTDAALRESSLERAPAGAAFTSIVCRCQTMLDLIERARRIAPHNVPVLLEGESGTGKEILARAIHNASPRKNGPFVAVNCGAIPENLAESEFFGHLRGAFTGAVQARAGSFREAEGGSLFLDEIGELPLPIQVKLLRPLQEGQITPIGASKPINVNVRVIAATHRTLLKDVASGHFREDLFYRLAVAVLKIPALREREGDLTLLIDHMLKEVNHDNATTGLAARSLSPAARNQLLRHGWPGNVRELANTLRRAVVWSSKTVVDAKDIVDATLPVFGSASTSGATGDPLNRPLGPGFKLDSVLYDIQRRYIERALELTKGKKREAAQLLGLNSHQVLTNRLERSR